VTAAAKKAVKQEVIRISQFNRTVMVVLLLLVGWEASEVFKIRIQTSAWQTQITENKLAVEANTKTLVDSIKQWNRSQQEMSNWMNANRQVVEKLHRDNPKIRVPKAPPVPETLPAPDRIIPDSLLTRPSISPTPSLKGIRRHKKPKAPSPTPSFWDRMWHQQKDQTR
jgi:hypothetical protein